MKISFLLLSFFLFLTVSSFATVYYSGSSYFFDFPKCRDLNITVLCEDRIDDGEFYFSPGCNLIERQTYINKWVCNCYDGYVLNFTINPGARNKCDIFMVYTQELDIVEKKEFYIRSYEYPIIYNYTYNYTYNQTEKLQPYIPEDINQTISELNRRIEEKEDTIKRLGESINMLTTEISSLEKRNLILLISLISLSVVIAVVVIVKLIQGWLRRAE